MREIRIPVNKFDLESFINEIFNFLKTVVTEDIEPSYAVAWIREDNGEPDYGPEDESRDHIEELMEERKVLFFPFSTSNVGEPIVCADGEEYELVELFEQDEDEEYTEFKLSSTEVLGFLLQVENRELVINSAIHGGESITGPYIRVVYDCDLFDEPMWDFVTHFIKD